jgi:signal transduction histidine kinase
VLSCRGSRQTGRSLGPLEVSTYLSIGRRLDISSPLILLHENGYKFIAPTNDSADLRLILAELRGKIESVGKGDLNVSVGFGNRIDEIGDLGRSFNQMVKELGANREEVARIHRVQMSSAECLATIGELAAGLAHEIRNPLAGVAGVIEIVGRDLPVTSPTRTAIQHARLSIVQISRILTDLLQTARPHLPEIRPMDLKYCSGMRR